MHIADPDLSEDIIQEEQGSRGIKRERGGAVERSATGLEGQPVKKGK